ncbi:hypothetical protein ACFLYH_03640 [Candidatus Dependentiae bacterium]
MKKLLFLFCILSIQIAKPTKNILQCVEQTEATSNSTNTFTEDELINSINSKIDSLDFINDKEKEKNKENLQELAKNLKDYKISGFSFCIDPNAAFLFDTQNPEFEVMYKNSKGKVKTRKYRAKIKSIGFKIEFDIKMNLIFFTNTQVNFFDSNKKIKLGSGIDIQSHIIDFTYASFKDMPGGLVILGFPFIQGIFKMKNLFLGKQIITNQQKNLLRSLSPNPEELDSMIRKEKAEIYKYNNLSPFKRLLETRWILPSYVKDGSLIPID